MFGASKIVALVLAFTLGFSCCAGVIVGGTAIALTTLRVRDIDKHIIDLPDEMFMGKNYEVDLLNLSALEMYQEIQNLRAMGDGLTINVLQKRYDLKIDSKLDVLLTEEVRNLPLTQAFSQEGVMKILSTVYIGKILGYTCVDQLTAEDADPALGSEVTKWVNAETGADVSGIQSYLAYICVGDLASGKMDINGLVGSVRIGDALGYTLVDEENDIWHDAHGEEVVGVMSAFAGLKVSEVGTEINDIKIGTLLGYTYDEEAGVWLDTETKQPIEGLMKVLGDCTMENVGSKIEEAQLGDLLGYYYDKDDERWEEDAENNVPLSGFMKVLAPCTMDNVGEKIEEAVLGDFFGYYYDEVDERWEEDAETNIPLSGLMKVLAPCTMANVGEKIEEALLGDLLGYYYDEADSRWEEDTETNTPVTGFMKILAASNMEDVGKNIENAQLGDLLGYQNIDGVWYTENDETNTLEVVDGFSSKIADEKLDSIGNAFDTLTIGDFVDEDSRTGIFAILDPDAEISNMAGAINDSIMGSPLQFFMNENLISLGEASETLDKMCKYFEDPMGTYPDGSDPMDMIFWQAYYNKNLYAYILEVEEGQPGYEKFVELKGYYEYETLYNESGEKIGQQELWEKITVDGVVMYRIPAWRTKPLNASFGGMISLLSGTAESEPLTPINDPSLLLEE